MRALISFQHLFWSYAFYILIKKIKKIFYVVMLNFPVVTVFIFAIIILEMHVSGKRPGLYISKAAEKQFSGLATSA